MSRKLKKSFRCTKCGERKPTTPTTSNDNFLYRQCDCCREQTIANYASRLNEALDTYGRVDIATHWIELLKFGCNVEVETGRTHQTSSGETFTVCYTVRKIGGKRSWK